MKFRSLILLFLLLQVGFLYCKPKVSFYLSNYNIGSKSIYLNDYGVGADRKIAIVSPYNQPDITICLGNTLNSTHDVIITDRLSIDSISIHFNDYSIGCDYNIYITELPINVDTKYAFTDNPVHADLIIDLQDLTLSMNKKKLVALIDTFAYLFLKK